tara:strand:- start:938 stop:1348 length:411 start_codon:yes stop_codon:yes gene_type:complete
MLLSKGEQVFFGPIPACVSFFEASKLPLPPMVNPADHFLESINYDFVQSDQLDSEGHPVAPQKPPHIAKIINDYESSQYRQQLGSCIELQTLLVHDKSQILEEPNNVDDFDVEKYNTSMGHQVNHRFFFFFMFSTN